VTGAVPEGEWQRATGLLRDRGHIALACHTGPDGDALGSLLAVGLALRARGPAPPCSFGDEPFVVPRSFGFLPGRQLLRPPGELLDGPPPDVLVTFDASSRDRLGRLEPLVDSAGTVLVVDHHARGDGYGDVRIVDPAAPATAVLAQELIARLDVPLDPGIATCLYTGLMTDTGSFRYVPADAAGGGSVHLLAARLLAAGVDAAAVAEQVWADRPFAYLRLLGRALDRAQIEPRAAGGLGLVWTAVEHADLTELGLPLEDSDGVIDALRSTGDAAVAVLFRGTADGAIRVSTRSRGGLDVGAVCQRLGGGGHAAAAGFTSFADLPATLAAVRRELDRAAEGAAARRGP
jgi:phosphoesterase RecJ-like protein